MRTVITREPINSFPVAFPLPKWFGWGLARFSLARSVARPPRQLTRVLLFTRLVRTLILPPSFFTLPWSRDVHQDQQDLSINRFYLRLVCLSLRVQLP